MELKKGVDVLVSFDTTGSMYSVLSAVRREITSLVTGLMGEIDGLRIGIIAHGDYCDADDTYTIKVLDLTGKEHMADIVKFINKVGSTYGGDSDECYELVLNTALEQVSWRDTAQKMIIMIGDSNPHKVGYRCSGMLVPNELDWKSETAKLAEKDIQIYAVHALAEYRRDSYKFYMQLAEITGGVYLTLNNFSEVTRILKASVYSGFSEEMLDRYVSVIRENGSISRSMLQNLNNMSRGSKYGTVSSSKIVSELQPVKAGRFQTLMVNDDNMSIKEFVELNGIKFKAGKAFYELTKPESVSQYKEIIIQDLKTGDFYEGDAVRDVLGLMEHAEGKKTSIKERVKPSVTKEYKVFIQSTSYNRKLVYNTQMLYELDMM